MTGQQLIERWAAWFSKYIVLGQDQAVVLALWAMNTWTYAQWSAVPYLSVTATTKRSGKTTVLEALNMTCQGPELKATIRVLSMVREITAAEGKITILIDEAEKLGHATLGDARTILATGYRDGFSHTVTGPKGAERYATYCPKAFASIGDIQPILRDRAIVLDLQRGTPGHSLTLERKQAEQEAQALRDEFVGVMRALALRKFTPVDPVWLTSPRDREIWTPLFSLAFSLGADKTIMDTLTGFSVDNALFKMMPIREYHDSGAEEDAETRTMGDRLLADMLTIYKNNETFIATEEIVARLRGILTSPWRGWKVKGLNEHILGALLSRFGLDSVQKRVSAAKYKGEQKDTRKRGYTLADVQAAAKQAGISATKL